MAKDIENIALFDMDGTLCDYDTGLVGEMRALMSPNEPHFTLPLKDDAPEYLKARKKVITSNEQWWENLPKFQLGFDVWKVAEELGYRKMILTQGPRENPMAWSGKRKWIIKHFGPEVDMTITRDKGLVYGRVLVDDYPQYALRWLDWRPRGLVIMPANFGNLDFNHPQVIRYDGTNLVQVKKAMKVAFYSKD